MAAAIGINDFARLKFTENDFGRRDDRIDEVRNEKLWFCFILYNGLELSSDRKPYVASDIESMKKAPPGLSWRS